MGVGFIFLLSATQGDIIAWDQLITGPDSVSILFLALHAVFFLFLGHLIRQNQEKRKGMQLRNDHLNASILDLTQANIGFQRYADSIVERSLADERRRISRELHDTVGYSLTNVRMLMEEAIGMYDGVSEDFVQILINTRNQAKEALEDTRTALKALRDIFEASETFDLRALRKLAVVFKEATHVDVRLDPSNSCLSYGKLIDHCVYRLVQEGMTNSFRHGKATEIQIYLFQNLGCLFITISDNGMGCGEVTPGIGISGMTERIGLLGGTIRFENGKHGFSINAKIPLPGKTE